MNKKNVCVIMSTFNGEKYLAVQLDSIISQKGVNLVIYIRDDGSTDNTPNMLNYYAKKYNNIIVSIEKNIGFRKSFLKALADAPECDYYGFADQDDYWFPNKLSSTLNLLEQKCGSLAFGNAIVTDENLVEKGKLYIEESIPSYPSSLTSSNTHGFLFCFDRRIRDLAIRFPVDKFTIPHDFWIVTVSKLFGSVVCDLNLMVAQYRRLPNSLSTIRPFFLFFNRLKSFIFGKGIVSEYSKIIIDLYKNDLSENDLKLVYACAYYKEDWKEKKYLLFVKDLKNRYKIKVLFNRL